MSAVDRHGLTVLVPDEPDRRIVHSVIYDELCVGVVDDGSRDEYRRIMVCWLTAAPTGSCSAARRSICSSGRRTPRARCSTRPCRTAERAIELALAE